MEDKILLSTREIQCSDLSEDPAALNAKFIICNFDTNGNNVKLNRKTVDNWLHTLVNQPVVAKIGITDSGEADFTSHNMHAVQRKAEDGNTYIDYEFDTSACGVFTGVQIETINGKEFITAEAKLWKRFPEFCAIVKRRLLSGTLNTSWEVQTVKSHVELCQGQKVKVIDEGVFLGHALLASYIPPAYKDSRVLEVASVDEDSELVDALSKDFAEVSNNKQKKEDLNLDLENKGNQVEATVAEGQAPTTVVTDDTVAEGQVAEASVTQDGDVATSEPDTSMLTEFDLRKALREAISDKLGKEKWDFYIIYHFPSDCTVWVQMWDATSELDIITFTYTVENDVVTMSEPTAGKLTVSVAQINTVVADLNKQLEEKNDAIVKANESIQELNTVVSELAPFKEMAEQAEQERISKENAEKRTNLAQYAIKSGFITEAEIAEEDGTIKAHIDAIDESAIKAIIAERFMESLNNTVKEKPETSEAVPHSNVKTNLETSEEYSNHREFIRTYINGFM